ncbi:MAG: putative acyltransferase [Arcticibacterium sp.]|jgi:predicted acyltransferase
MNQLGRVFFSSKSNKTFVQQRLYSLDALRGFDMFWIIGGEEIFHALAEITHTPFWQSASDQFTHPEWNGFHLYDLIFPLFLFLAGVSTPFSIGKALDKGKSKKQVLLRVIKRGFILVFLGIIYNNGLEIRPLSDIRFSSVLGRIGIAYMLGNIIFIYSKERIQIIWFSGLLVAYWLLLKFTSAPGYPIGDLTMEGNFASYIDRLILPGKLSKGIHDTVGFFNNIPAISTALAGILTGAYLKKEAIRPIKKVIWMTIFGVISLIIAQIWNLDFPINKNLWSSSFVMQTTGLSLLLLTFFYYVIDVKGFKSWAFFFKVIGMNSILIYVSGKFFNWAYTTKALFQWLLDIVDEPYSLLYFAICVILVKWFFLKFLYHKKLFLRV